LLSFFDDVDSNVAASSSVTNDKVADIDGESGQKTKAGKFNK